MGAESPLRGGTAAAFFDLDRTLMEGSSAFQFGRAAYRAGLMGRRQLVADAWANIRFRLRGSTDSDTEALRDRISASLEGVRVRDLERLGADVLAGVLPRIYPQMLAVAYEHQDAGRRIYIVTAASQELADLLAYVLRFDGAIGSRFSEVVDGVHTGRPVGQFVYRTGKAVAIAELGVPWWTYRAIDVVDAWMLGRARPIRVFEYGSGASTLWLAGRADEVISIEHHLGSSEVIGPALADLRGR